MNPHGHPQTLVPAERENTLGVRHGVYSRSGRVLALRAEEIAAIEALSGPSRQNPEPAG